MKFLLHIAKFGLIYMLIGIAAAILSLIVIWNGDEISVDEIVPREASEKYSTQTSGFGSGSYCSRCHISREGLDKFAREFGYRFDFVETLEDDWSGFSTDAFDGLREANSGKCGYLHCLAKDRTKKLSSGGVEGYLEFIYDIERETLYSLYWD